MHSISHRQKDILHMCSWLNTFINYAIIKLHTLSSWIPCDHCSILIGAFNKWKWGPMEVHPHPLFPGLLASALSNCSPGLCVITEQWSTPRLYWEFLQGWGGGSTDPTMNSCCLAKVGEESGNNPSSPDSQGTPLIWIAAWEEHPYWNFENFSNCQSWTAAGKFIGDWSQPSHDPINSIPK